MASDQPNAPKFLHFPIILVWAVLVVLWPVRAQGQAPVYKNLLAEADAAMDSKDYQTALMKIGTLVNTLDRNAPPHLVEMLYYKIGLACQLDKKHAEAEQAFTTCIQKFPKGIYTSRCYLEVGRACVAQEIPQKKDKAIKALQTALTDPKYSLEAGLLLLQLMNKREETLAVYHGLMRADIDSFPQASAAVDVIRHLAPTGNGDALPCYLEHLSHQTGIRKVVAWFVNQLIVFGDEAVSAKEYETALIFYQAVPSRQRILEIQTFELESMHKNLLALEAIAAAEKNNPDRPRSSAADLIGRLRNGMDISKTALPVIKEKVDLDAAMLMRRGRCLFYLNRHEEALLCFRSLRTKYPSAADAKAAACAEISILSKLKNTAELQTLCVAFLRAYPDADNTEQVASLAGEALVQEGKWDKIGEFFEHLENTFPKSANIDRFVFFQAVAKYQNGDHASSISLLDKFLKNHPESKLLESAVYYMAMANFHSKLNQPSLAFCNEYLTKFPDGRHAGEILHRRALILFGDKGQDQSDKIISDLDKFLKDHPKDAVEGSILCLLADVHARKMNTDAALECYKNAVWTESPDDVIQYALKSATSILEGKKDLAGITRLHEEFLNRKPDSPLAQVSANLVVKMKTHGKTTDGAVRFLADELKDIISDPTNERVENLIDELVKTFIVGKKSTEIDLAMIDKQLVDALGKAINGSENLTTNARIYYARARLCQMLKREDRADLYLKGIATNNAKDPAVLSPALLEVCGGILLKKGDIDGAAVMFQRLRDRYKDSIFAVAGPVGLGGVALARKDPEEALRIFDGVLGGNPEISYVKESILGKLQALVELGQHETAGKLALEIVGDRTFRGEPAGKAYLLLARAHRNQAVKEAPDKMRELLKQAHGIYQRVYVTYQGYPYICAEAYWQAYETAKDLHEEALAVATLKALASNPKLQNTQRFKDANKLSP